MAEVTAAREHLIAALEADLIGPYEGAEAFATSTERLRIPPSRWYLTGFLAAMEAREVADPPDDGAGAGSDTDAEDGGAPDDPPKRRHLHPASIGLSVLVPAARAGEADTVVATVRWADYLPEEEAEPEDEAAREAGDAAVVEAAETALPVSAPEPSARRIVWRRQPRAPVAVELPLDPRVILKGVPLPGEPGVWLRGRLADADGRGLPPGTRALSLFVVNQRGSGDLGEPGESGDTRQADKRYLFQVGLDIEHPHGFVPRPNARGETSSDPDEQIADLQFRHCTEWAVGHGVSARPLDDAEGGPVRRVGTTWLPRAEVRRVVPHEVPGLAIEMETLAELAAGVDPAPLAAALNPLPAAYETWIVGKEAIPLDTVARRATRERLLRDARTAKDRIAAGIALLTSDAGADVREAFHFANRAMALQARRKRDEAPQWRLFQLAFVLLNLPGVADGAHPDREIVELIYFPTGGGKTEAYLGLIATTLALRRLRGRERPDRGEGVAVLLRYTLRLLTLDQLARAATLLCALELLRRERPERLGEGRFTIGLWVGRSATANTLEDAARQITDWKNRPGGAGSSPFPLVRCPWCDREIDRDGVRVRPDPRNPQEVVVHCLDDGCAFHSDASPDGLPVLFVDEQIYRELPAFLVATVDKLAMLPWRGETGMLFGRAEWRQVREGQAGNAGKVLFYGPLDATPREARRLPEGLLPPELIVQDELHLISGPLGTLVGLYETVVEALCRRGSGPVPKILAATATVRQAAAQTRALFGRVRPPAVFPPPGVEDGETFFARVDRTHPGRLYLGVAAPGRAMKALLLRAYVALLSSARKVWDESARDADKRRTADAYMTLVGYFNSLRELGGMRRLVEDEVVRRADKQPERRPEGADPRRWFRARKIQAEPVELTSRESTAGIAEAKARLDLAWSETRHVDVLLASNMISVGVDISRLGLMIVAGQPKTTAEYIQASSRVGRRPEVGPGLVVTCLNVYKPRDRSHYEHFLAYHDSFYRDVEASSLTPFSGPALERGLAGSLVALARLADPLLTAPAAAGRIGDHRELGEAAVRTLAERAGRHRAAEAPADDAPDEPLGAAVARLATELLDAWETLAREAAEGAGGRRYSRFDLDKRGGRPLLFQVLEPDRPEAGTLDARFAAPTSMRDVEPTVHLWLERQPLGGHRA